MKVRVAVVLETMWGTAGNAPRWFIINPRNFSGRRLYYLTSDVLEDRNLWVTNACRERVSSPNEHGKPDPEWLLSNLKRVTCDLLLVCGKVAQATVLNSNYAPPSGSKTMFIPHPAARNWSREKLDSTRAKIKEILDGSN